MRKNKVPCGTQVPRLASPILTFPVTACISSLNWFIILTITASTRKAVLNCVGGYLGIWLFSRACKLIVCNG